MTIRAIALTTNSFPMNKAYGFMRVAAVSPRVALADPESNAGRIVDLARRIFADEAPSVLVFPELCITGYTCADLFGQSLLLEGAERALARIARETAELSALIAVGLPVPYAGRLYNCAALLRGGRILGLVPKTYLPNSAEFYEARWFESAALLGDQLHPIRFAGQECLLGVRQLFRVGPALIGVEICQDLWVPAPPSTGAALAGAQLILNLSASNETILKHDYRKSLVSATSARLNAAYVYASCGIGESTQDLVWGASSLIYENGSLLAENPRFGEDSSWISADVDIEKLNITRRKATNFKDILGRTLVYSVVDAGPLADTDFDAVLKRKLEAHPFVPSSEPEELEKRCREILSIQVAGLSTRLEHVGCKTAVIGISGGLDSTLALLVAVLAADRLKWERKRIIGVTMPGFGTTGRTKGNADALMEGLGISRKEVSIVPAVTGHLKDLGHSLDEHDATYENAQARERTQILMDLAGQEGGLVVGTGDLSELALGWCTFNGDHMSMYGVNAGVPKTLVQTLVRQAAEDFFPEVKAVLLDILDTPISPELVPAAADGTILQVTEDLIGPYELHDFFLYHFFRWGCAPEKLLFLAGKAFEGRYKAKELRHWLDVFLKRFFAQQFKRSCLPDGPKIGSVSLSPRGDWRMPSDAGAELWRKQLEED